ncbi:tumor-associated protein domain-containing protein [Ditylenchus destructor]|uniref:Tumor-associated protein domain-containing protein n=1 Tax=Ditylenchus destructor TaxID=166010 RepID=A0AAD4N5N1_9BILA|nr:tumor-associated protein domain-containing protein [Ditylenchus destructor]
MDPQQTQNTSDQPTTSQGRAESGGLVIEQDRTRALPLPPDDLPEHNDNINNAHNNHRFGAVRDRLFHVMLVKMTISYSKHVSYIWRRIIEFSVLVTAISSLLLLVYVHFMFNHFPGTCLDSVKDTWPKKGVVRVEVIQNLKEFHALQARAQFVLKHHLDEEDVTRFELKNILIRGPIALPKELRTSSFHRGRRVIADPKLDDNNTKDTGNENGQSTEEGYGRHWISNSNSSFAGYVRSLVDFFYQPMELHTHEMDSDGLIIDRDPGEIPVIGSPKNVPIIQEEIEELHNLEEAFGVDDNTPDPAFVYVIEYSLHYGLLKLSPAMRREFGISVMLIQLDAETDKCFGDWKSRFLMRHLIGFEDIVMSSVRALAENETEKGYLRDMISGEHYHFVNMGISRVSYLTALLVMLIFTFAISMLLRFSHHQIFLFIVDLLQMFDSNQPLVFPIAPFLTVILALVGMEAIMSEIFNDTSTAFYVILLVWMADQYDAIVCHSPIGKRYWLRFFYLYHFAFYAYQYRFNGQYGGLALLTSAFFVLHSMIFFFHHYEMPLIIYQEQLQRIVTGLHHNNTVTSAMTLNVSITMTSNRNSRQRNGALENHAEVQLGRSGRELSATGNASDSASYIRADRNEGIISRDNESLSQKERIPDDKEIPAVPNELLRASRETADQLVGQAIQELFPEDQFSEELYNSCTK